MDSWRGQSIKQRHRVRYTHCMVTSPMLTLPRPNSFVRVHPKLQNFNLHNITHSLISRNPRERMFVVQISLLVVTFLSLISRSMSLKQSTKEVNPHHHIAPCVNMWSVCFFFSCHLLNVGACNCHIVWEGQVEWTTPIEVRG